MKSEDRQKHFTATYVNLRIGMAVIAMAFPILLWVGGLLQGLELQPSMSDYYHAGSPAGLMRDWFVGLLFAVGVFLYLYKGFTVPENLLLNFAGIFAIGIAIFPMEVNCGDDCNIFSLHGTFAVSFFLCIAAVCIFCASKTLRLLKNDALEARYSRWYRLLGIGMVLSPLAAFAWTTIFDQKDSTVFFVEAHPCGWSVT